MNIKAWSYSALSQYLTCPQAFYRVRVAKDVKDEQSQEALSGQQLHTELEHLVSGAGVSADSPIYEWPKAVALALNVKAAGAAPEMALGVTRDWEPCAFFDPQVWGRTKVDVAIVNNSLDGLVLLDWKTGRPQNAKYQTPFELECQASILKAYFPHLQRVVGRYYFVKGALHWAGLLDDNHTPRKYYDLSDIPAHRTKIERLCHEINARAPESFRTRKNPLCNGWCAVKACKHWRPKRGAL
jgi:hypothetical protein